MKPSIPKGTRDFSPEQVRKRSFIFNTIKRIFVKYGYQPIETPTMENLSTLTGKYGEEGDKLLFKVLNNGDFLNKADRQALSDHNSAKLIPSISKRGLRYDLTVPFARYVVMHQNEINFPFKRYQIQPVWRADRPQKGRYQEFYQCDVDVVGSDSLMNEAELVQIYDEVFASLGIHTLIKVNNRKVLFGMAEAANIPEQFVDMTIAIDKLEKIGLEGVKKEMSNRGIPENSIEQISQMLKVQKVADLDALFQKSPTGLKGVEELKSFYNYLDLGETTNVVNFDITLARGLSYYTGCIFEVVLDLSKESQKNIQMGSLGGGGRYDDLTGIFGLPNVSGVGISFGAARIFDVMEELNLFSKKSMEDLQLLLIAFDDASHHFAFKCLNLIRQSGINAELYPEPAKLKKQMKYANARGVPYVALAGSTEMEMGQLTLKNMKTGEQEQLSMENVLTRLKE